MKLFVISALLIACNADCSPQPTPIQPRRFDSDASDACVRICSKLDAWSCPEAKPTPSGESCESFCDRTPFLDKTCADAAQTKADLVRCGVRCIQ